MPFYTPLRYPGGKRRLAEFTKQLIEVNRLHDIEYAEPYAGGASLALELLFEEYASVIHINDLSRPVYAFWHAVLNDTAAFCAEVAAAPITIDEWHKQRAIYDSADRADLFELALATFYLNRTNRSGIIAGGVIGGKKQTGQWSIGARFSKDDLIRRIRKVGRYRNRIMLYRQDAMNFIEDVVDGLPANSLAFLDPPYIDKGASLYLNTYTTDDHIDISERVSELRQPWVVTYDYDPAVSLQLYPNAQRLSFELSYSAQDRRGGREAMFISRQLALPAGASGRFAISRAASRYPVYATLEVT